MTLIFEFLLNETNETISTRPAYYSGMLTAHPEGSIIVPVYNGGEPFQRCIRAICNSAFTDWELIVVDDPRNSAIQQNNFCHATNQ